MKFFLSLAFLLTGCFCAAPPNQYERFEDEHKAAVEGVKADGLIDYEGTEGEPYISVVPRGEVREECKITNPSGCYTNSYEHCPGMDIILVADDLEKNDMSATAVHEFIHAIWDAHGVPVGTPHTRHKEIFQETWNQALVVLERDTDYNPRVASSREM